MFSLYCVVDMPVVYFTPVKHHVEVYMHSNCVCMYSAGLATVMVPSHDKSKRFILQVHC